MKATQPGRKSIIIEFNIRQYIGGTTSYMQYREKFKVQFIHVETVCQELLDKNASFWEGK